MSEYFEGVVGRFYELPAELYANLVPLLLIAALFGCAVAFIILEDKHIESALRDSITFRVQYRWVDPWHKQSRDLRPFACDQRRAAELRTEWARFRAGTSAYRPYLEDLFKSYSYRLPRFEGAGRRWNLWEAEVLRRRAEEARARGDIVTAEPITLEALHLDEELFVRFLDYYLDDFKKKVAYARAASVPTPAAAPRSNLERVSEIIRKHRQQAPPGRTRIVLNRAEDAAEELLTLEEIERELGPDAFDDPRVRALLDQSNLRVERLRPRST